MLLWNLTGHGMRPVIKNRVVHLKSSFLRGEYEALPSAIGQILSKNCWNYHLAFSEPI